MRISDWSSDVCSSDLKQAIERLLRGTNLVARFDDRAVIIRGRSIAATASEQQSSDAIVVTGTRIEGAPPAAPVIRISSEDIRNAGQSDLGEVARSLPQSFGGGQNPGRSEEHTSELQSLMRISYAVFCLKKTKNMK